ncbi:unnamed protein product [Lactuca saligna]|uniref:Uncharacterized protein n=1 Tax=Lactuca saligna TaxID=75948 RepID=A0AA35YXN1_LACSI|nr:unnamed protein product [Lactuca saligna]
MYMMRQSCQTSISCVEVEYLLKAHESCLTTLIENVDMRNDERVTNQCRTFDYEISKIHDVVKDRREIFEKLVYETEASLEFKVKDLRDLISTKVKKLDNYCVSVNKKVDVVASERTRLIEYLTAFNKDYYNDLKDKTEKDVKVFEKIENFLSG